MSYFQVHFHLLHAACLLVSFEMSRPFLNESWTKICWILFLNHFIQNIPKDNSIVKTSSVLWHLTWAYLENCQIFHSVKIVHIWSFSGPHFPGFGLNTERYSTKYGPEKLWIRSLFTQNVKMRNSKIKIGVYEELIFNLVNG